MNEFKEELEILERGILNKYNLINNEFNETVMYEKEHLEEIFTSSVVISYLAKKSQKIDKVSNLNNEIISLKLNHKDGDILNIQSFLAKKEQLSQIIYLMIDIETVYGNLNYNDILEKDFILKSSEVSKTLLYEILDSSHKGLFMFISKKSNSFMISPFLLDVFHSFKDKIKLSVEENNSNGVAHVLGNDND